MVGMVKNDEKKERSKQQMMRQSIRKKGWK